MFNYYIVVSGVKCYVKILFIFFLFFVFSIFIPVYAQFVPTEKIYDDLDRIGTDKITEVFYNGDGSYSYYLETTKNVGEINPFDQTYIVPDDKYRYGTGEIFLHDEVDPSTVKVEVVSDGIKEAFYDPVTKKITWKLDFGMSPTKFFHINSFMEFPFYPKNTLKIIFRLKEGIYGKISPIKKAKYVFIGKLRDGDKVFSEYFFLRGVFRYFDEKKPVLEKKYYYDKKFSQEITEDNLNSLLDPKIYVQYILKNPNTYPIVVSGFVDTIDVKTLYNGFDYIANTLLSFEKGTKKGIVLAPSSRYILTGEAILHKGDNTTKTHIYGFYDIAIYSTNTLDSSVLSGSTYIEKTGSGNIVDYSRYKNESSILDASNLKLPALESSFRGNGSGCNKDVNGLELMIALGNNTICELDSRYVALTKNSFEKKKFDIELGQKIAIKTFILSFEEKGGSEVRDQKHIIYNGTGMKPAILIRSGYTFKGWYTDDNSFNNEYDFNTPITSNTTIYAKWEKNKLSSGRKNGGSSLKKDSCPYGDFSPSYYDNICGEKRGIEGKMEGKVEKGGEVNEDIFNPDFKKHQCYDILDEKTIYQGNKVTNNFLIAHQMLYSYNLTIRRGTRDYSPERKITRQEAAKFMVEFAKKVLCRVPNYKYNNQFTDIENANPTLLPYIKQSYEYKIFHGDGGGASKGVLTTFRPFDEISYDELVAVMIRLVRNKYGEDRSRDWAKKYKEYIKTRVKNTTKTNNYRANIAETIYDLYKMNDYNWETVGFVIVD